MGNDSRPAEQGVDIDRKRFLAIAGVGALLLSVLMAVSAYANHLTTAGEPELFNLEHVYNFNPATLDGDTALFPDGVTAGDTKGSDVEFFTHTVPLRDYDTGQLIDETGNPVTEPVYADRDFAVMGSYDRGGVIFDITDPDNPEYVNVAPCQQPRNDVGIRTFDDPVTGQERVVLALTQQTGIPCPNWEEGGSLTVDVNTGPNAGDSYPAVQWGDTAAVTGQTAELVYGGTGCTAAQMAAAAPPGAFTGKIAIVTTNENPYNPADQCPRFSFFQKANAAQANGAIGLIHVDNDDIPRTGVTAVTATIPVVEINNSHGMPLVQQIVEDGLSVEATLNPGEHTVTTFGNEAGSGGIGVFDISDPYSPQIMYRIMTTEDGVHNFAFHPTAPFGYVSPGELPGVIQDMPIFDFTNLDAPVVKEGVDTPQTPGGIHDVELSVTGDFIYAASENNYHIYDNSDPANPVQVGLIAGSPQNPPTVPTSGSYAHGLYPDSGQEIMVGQVESIVAGGFLAPGSCPGEGLATYDISGLYVPGASKELPAGPISVYNPPVVGDPAPRFCTSHFGRFVPDTRIFTLGWYVAGVRVVDFSDPFFPVGVATAVMADGDGTSNTWAAKVYPKKGGYIFAGDMERGFDVFKWNGDGDAPWETEQNQPPTAVDDEAEVAAGGAVNIDVRANDFDANDGRDNLTVSIESGPSHGNVIVEADNTVTYTHNGGSATSDSFEYRVTDPSGAFDTATVTVSIDQDGTGDDGDMVTGGGYLLPTSGHKINFGFNATSSTDGTVDGHLTLNDKADGVKVRIDQVITLGSVDGECGSVTPGPESAQFTGTGTFNGEGADFRVCVADLGEPGNSPQGADRFYLECTVGCSYATGDRTADDVIDGGNIQVHTSGDTASESGAAEASEAGAGNGASVLILDPLLLTETNLSTELLTVVAYDVAGNEAAGVAVTLESVAADGTVTNAVAVTDSSGMVVFTVAVPTGDVEHTAHVGDLSSNAVHITGLL